MSERRDSDGRLHHHRAAAPKAPPKALKYDPIEMECRGDEVPGSFGDNHRKALVKKSKESSEPQALMLRHIEERVDPDKGVVSVPVKSYHDEEKVSLARAGETVLETFYGMFYACDDETKEWKLAVNGFIPLCFIQERGNANKPFKIIAVSGTTRLMEFSVTKDTKCAQNKAFVKWNEGTGNMYGVRFAKEGQANQFYSALSRMKSTLIKTAELFKQPERKAIVSQISDPTTASVPHSKTSLIVKLPNQETTVMSVAGLLTMSELFHLICKKESLNPQEHQLSLPRIGNKELTYESDTVLGSLKIREVSIIYVGLASDNSEASGGTRAAKVESLLEDENEKGKQLDITLPNGQQRTLLVPINMPVRQLETYICKKENLNPRYHSLQSNDFKHQCFDAGCAVGEIELSDLRLLDKRGHSSRSKLTKAISSDDSCVDSSNESLDYEERKATLKDSKTSSNSEEMATIGETSSTAIDPNSSKSSHIVKPPIPQPYSARSNQAVKPSDKLQLNELKSSHSFSGYEEKRTNTAVREPSLRESGKTQSTKRKAPRPPRPPQPSPRPTKKENEQTQPPSRPSTDKTTATGSSSCIPQGSPNVSRHQRHAKKRPAPARPPAPKPLRQRSESNPSADDLTAEAGFKNHDRPPPEFCAPPPPDNAPPPLDECEHPVSPLSDEEVHEATWSSSFESPEVNGYPEEAQPSRKEQHPSPIKAQYRVKPVVAARHERPERPAKQPERPSPPRRQSSLPPTPTSPSAPDRSFMSPEPIPLKFLLPTPEKLPDSSASEFQEDEQDDESSRINFGDSRSSSVDISSFPESEMFVISPIEGYKPFPFEPPVEFAEKDLLKANTKSVQLASEEIALPPPIGFSKSEPEELTLNLSTSNDSGNVEYSGTDSDVTFEDMVVPPPPVLSEEDLPQSEYNEKPDSLSQTDINSIPPPIDFASPPDEFANPPAEFADETVSPKPQKKKLGLNTSSFPWLAEPPPSFNAEIKTNQPDVQEEVKTGPGYTTSTEVIKIKPTENLIPIEDKKASSIVLREKETEFESWPGIEIPEPFVQDSNQKIELENEPIKTNNLDNDQEDVKESYKTPFDDLEDVSPSAEEPDEGFDDLPEPVFEPFGNKDLESKYTNTDIEKVSRSKADYRLDLSESPELSPPTPPLTSPPGSGYVSPSLPSPLCSPREDAHQESVPAVESVPAKSQSDEIKNTTSVVSLVDSKSNESSKLSSPSSDAAFSTEPIELPNPPPITVPPLRRYSDLAADISFSTSEMKTNHDVALQKENSIANASSKEGSQTKQYQAPTGYKRPISGSSWADIKNREKQMEEERKKKNEQYTNRESPPPSLVFRNLNRSSATAIRPKSWVAPNSKSFNPILPSVYKHPKSSKQENSTTDTKRESSDSSGSEQVPSGTTLETPEPKYPKSSSTTSNASEPKVSPTTTNPSKTEATEPPKHKPVVIVPSSNRADTQVKATDPAKDKPVVIVPSSDRADTQVKATDPAQHKPVVIVPSSDRADTQVKATAPAKDKPVVIVPSSDRADTQVKAAEPAKDKPVVILHRSSSADTKPETADPLRPKPIAIVPKTPASDTKDDKDDMITSGSLQSTTKVVMRKKSEKPDIGEKRKSVQDMMTMFGASKESIRSSDDANPQQSPALRSLEEKISRSSKQYGISNLVDALSSKPGLKDSISDSKKESKIEKRSEKSAETKAQSESVNTQRVHKMFLASDGEASTEPATGKKEEDKKEGTKKEDSKANDSRRPRTSSLNARQKYNALFPTKNEPLPNSKETTKSSSSSHEKKDITSSSSASSTDDICTGSRKEVGETSEPVVTLREKELSQTVDPYKRRSMPVYVIEKNEARPQPKGGNLKILMAPQITDVDVVPKGRVAAMKAAWKKEGN